ncbi:MFS transporter [Actinomycetospora sp. OC33-EN08]|uniref:MFS transporter n=1 Tax=Actinomycetospora aurantiaca TaxID=3129233 RepID=A0ABU8MRE2_9PSEU
MTTQPTRARAWALALLALGAAGAGIPSPLYPAYQADLGFSDLTLTAVYAVYPLVSVPAVFLLGPLGDRLPPRRVLRAGVAIAAAGSLVLAVAGGTGWLLLGRIAYGVALAVMTGAGVAVASSGADKVRAGRVSALVFVIGTGAGPVLGGALTRYGPTPGLVPFAVNLVLLAVVFVGLGSVAGPGHTTDRTVRRSGLSPAARRALVIAAVSGFLGWAVAGLFLGLTASLVERALDLRDPLVAGSITAAVLVWSALTLPLVGRLGLGRSQLVGLIALTVPLAILAIGVDSLLGIVAAAVVAGLANGLLYGAATTTVSTAAPADRASSVAAAVYSAFYLGAGLPALLVGLLTTTRPLDVALSDLAIAVLPLTAVIVVLTAFGGARARRPRGGLEAEFPDGTRVAPPRGN